MDILLKKAAVAKSVLNLWPPFWGSGIKITHLSKDFHLCQVRLAFRWWNKNANRSQFGGAMFAMTDPIYPLMLMAVLGNRYHIWDSEASIKFVTPGRGKVFAKFQLDKAFIETILIAAASGEKFEPEVTTEVLDEKGKVVAVIKRKLYIRLKRQYRPQLKQVA
ncbi:DUF4442 domain-containing protein [Agarivorans aestuarii]|uniref:DUF4442 domain-containing protein n=1 Tax=Agarivorans aestuarii TaxID=1563703 RepID=UPI001C81B032|nr:DUF4442 domain-containing protein [Agarivorans aestuarii]